MNQNEKTSNLGAEILAGLKAFRDSLQAGTAIEKNLTVRTVEPEIQVAPSESSPTKTGEDSDTPQSFTD